jgi:hypothetical protein
VVTTGNHVWDQREALQFAPHEERFLRPVNFPRGTPGRGSGLYVARNGARVMVSNIMGRVFMHPELDDPFQAGERELAACPLGEQADAVVIDFHAEATSEKMAMGWYLDSRVTALLGTHTHVATADTRILPGGTAYQSDVGMTGAHDSIIGVEKPAVLRRFLTALPVRMEPAKGGVELHAAIVEADEQTGRAISLRRLSVCRDGTIRESEGP